MRGGCCRYIERSREMILYAGNIYDSSEQNRLLDELKTKIPQALAMDPLEPETVINAIERLRQDTLAGKFDDLLVNLPKDAVSAYKTQASVLLSGDMLRQKLRTELGVTDQYETHDRQHQHLKAPVCRQRTVVKAHNAAYRVRTETQGLYLRL